MRGPGKRTRSPSSSSKRRRLRLSANAGSRSMLPTHRQSQDRSVIVASASSSTSWPLPGITAATQSSAPPVVVPGERGAASTPGSATCTRSPGNEYSSSSVRLLHALVVTTEAAAERTAPSRVRASLSAVSWPSGMCTSATRRSRFAWGTSTSGAVEATSPSSSARAPSGISLDDAGERCVRRCVGSRPGARHGVDVHRPADLGERAADLAVVGVASARPGRIVDAVRYDDVDCRHSARS